MQFVSCWPKSDVHQSAFLETGAPLAYATDRSMVIFPSLQDPKPAALSVEFLWEGWQERQLEAKFERREYVAVIVSFRRRGLTLLADL